MEKTNIILFNYLRDILYDQDKAKLNLEDLPAEFQDLGEGMMFLDKCVREARELTTAIAKGDLGVNPPDVENVFAGPLKELQGNLRHLTWQTHQVAKGDFSQHVEFMGEFSDSFNTMIQQLKEQTSELQEKQAIVENQNKELEIHLELLKAITDHTKNMFFVVAEADHSILYMNKSAEDFLHYREEIVLDLFKRFNEQKDFEKDKTVSLAQEYRYEGHDCYYALQSYCIVWNNQQAFVHIVLDETEYKEREKFVYSLAVTDQLTGLKNRRYAIEKIHELREQGKDFIVSVVDLDYLKYCNDTFGHLEGDSYIIDVGEEFKSVFSEVCRVGGDEFLIFETELSIREHHETLEFLRTKMRENSDSKKYIKSFSYGSIQASDYSDKIPIELIKEADKKMYAYKNRFKLNNNDFSYRDRRVKPIDFINNND